MTWPRIFHFVTSNTYSGYYCAFRSPCHRAIGVSSLDQKGSVSLFHMGCPRMLLPDRNVYKMQSPLYERIWRRSVVVCASSHMLDTKAERRLPHSFNVPLDRAGHLRGNMDALRDMLDRDDTKTIVFNQGKALASVSCQSKDGCFSFAQGSSSSNEDDLPLNCEGAPARVLPFVVSPKDKELSSVFQTDPGYLFLGITKDGTAVFACCVSTVPPAWADEVTQIDVRKAMPEMSPEDASVFGLANGMIQWHSKNSFCSRTGQEMGEIVLGGHGRRVKVSGSVKQNKSVYPRIDPAVIVGAFHGDWFLLGRKASWTEGRYSLLAGFVEVGETLEAAVLREVQEESGVELDINSVKYHSSQPWPFPQSLMTGFIAHTLDFVASNAFGLLSHNGQQAARAVGILPEEVEHFAKDLTIPPITIDKNEIEDARWFHAFWLGDKLHDKRDSGDAIQDNFHIPGKHALANQIISDSLSKIDACSYKSNSKMFRVVNAIDFPISVDSEFKYVLIRISDTTPDGEWSSKLFVRGDPRAAYHNHVFTKAKEEMRALGFQSAELDVLGGGRMQIDCKKKSIQIYGYSAAFGQAPHEISACIIRRDLPFHDVHISYDGY